MNIELLRRVSEAGLLAVVEAGTWTPGSVILVADGGSHDIQRIQCGFTLTIIPSSFTVLEKRGFGRLPGWPEWIEHVSSGALGVPVIYSTATHEFHRGLVQAGKVVAS